MSDPRKSHVSKSRWEKEQYVNMLKSQHAEDPTFEFHETESTNSVVVDEAGSSSIARPELKNYEPDNKRLNKEILYGIIVFGITSLLFLFGMSLNREIGVLDERTNTTKDSIETVEINVKQMNEQMKEMAIEQEVIKRIFETTAK